MMIGIEFSNYRLHEKCNHGLIIDCEGKCFICQFHNREKLNIFEKESKDMEIINNRFCIKHDPKDSGLYNYIDFCGGCIKCALKRIQNDAE